MVQDWHRPPPPLDEPTCSEIKQRNIRVRTLRPTCNTCKWFMIRNLNMGNCCLNPPVMLGDKSGVGHASRSIVRSDDFCSHHETAFKGDY